MRDHAAIMIREGEKFLFVQRSASKKTLPNIWAFPSGTIEEGEAAEVTTVREAREELGVDVEVLKILDSVDLPEFGTRLVFVICGIKSGTPMIQAADEIQALRWMSLEDFFREYTDEQIGHGLVYLRQHPERWT
ncbi:NUDIX hydrolase [Candidatus Uhrbacteria bacterium]|nr:NUDIX hydrolase [Candidatus Uhrbacteria bacterium]